MNKKIGVGQPTRIENAKILIANTAMDTDKIKIYGKCLFDSLSLQSLTHLLSILVRIANHLVLRLVDCFTTKNFHAGARLEMSI